jgi:hypothetical protein
MASHNPPPKGSWLMTHAYENIDQLEAEEHPPPKGSWLVTHASENIDQFEAEDLGHS